MRARTAGRAIDWSALLVDAVTRPGVVSSAYDHFWRYSVGNQVLALWQCHLRGIEPGPIHTYRGWAKLRRQVRRGEKALTLVRPVEIKRKCGEAAPEGALPSTDQGISACVAPRELRFTIFVERPFWFVLAQTDGDAARLVVLRRPNQTHLWL